MEKSSGESGFSGSQQHEQEEDFEVESCCDAPSTFQRMLHRLGMYCHTEGMKYLKRCVEFSETGGGDKLTVVSIWKNPSPYILTVEGRDVWLAVGDA
jgi:hypothetical protein